MQDTAAIQVNRKYRFSLTRLIVVFLLGSLLVGVAGIQYRTRYRMMKTVAENQRLKKLNEDLGMALVENHSTTTAARISEKLMRQLVRDPKAFASAVEFLNKNPPGSLRRDVVRLDGLTDLWFCKYCQPANSIEGWWSGESICFIVKENPFAIVDTMVGGHARLPELRSGRWVVEAVQTGRSEAAFEVTESGFQRLEFPQMANRNSLSGSDED
jgi:cell division protein FtsL